MGYHVIQCKFREGCLVMRKAKEGDVPQRVTEANLKRSSALERGRVSASVPQGRAPERSTHPANECLPL